MTFKKLIRPTLILIAFTLFLLLAGCEAYKTETAPPEYVGTWIGLGMNQISNEFLNQRQVPLFLEIKQNGAVSGYVGDASFKNSKLETPAWWMKVVGKKQPRIVLTLDGYIVNRESFRREGGIIVFEGFQDNELVCHFTSTGSQASVRNMVLSVTNIRLHHPKQ